MKVKSGPSRDSGKGNRPRRLRLGYISAYKNEYNELTMYFRLFRLFFVLFYVIFIFIVYFLFFVFIFIFLFLVWGPGQNLPGALAPDAPPWLRLWSKAHA